MYNLGLCHVQRSLGWVVSVKIRDTVHNRMSHQYSHAKPCHFNLLLPGISNRNQELVHDNCPLCCHHGSFCCGLLEMPAHVRRVNANRPIRLEMKN